jgi:predicted RecA/RadA family phage recombinase
MTLARYAPDPNKTFPFLADAAILAGAVVCQGVADGSVKLPVAAEDYISRVIGVAANPIASGSVGDVITGGIAVCNAAGTITRGDLLCIAGVTGTVKAVALGTAVHCRVIGIAMESAVSGDKVAVMIGPYTLVNGILQAFVAGVGGTTAACACVISDASLMLAILPSGADPTTAVLGISVNTTLAGETAYVVTSGITLGKDSGSGYSVGANLAIAGATGQLKTNGIGAGTNTWIVGQAMQTATASQSKLVRVTGFTLQG